MGLDDLIPVQGGHESTGRRRIQDHHDDFVAGIREQVSLEPNLFSAIVPRHGDRTRGQFDGQSGYG
jgi:hypothetical protein